MAVLPDLKVAVPNLQLDGIPTEVIIERHENSRAFSLTVKLSVPDVQRFSSNPDSNLVVSAIKDAIACRDHRLRMTLISDKDVQVEFDRLQPDGSVRDLLPEEGTW